MVFVLETEISFYMNFIFTTVFWEKGFDMAEGFAGFRILFRNECFFLLGGVRLNLYSFCHEECLDVAVFHLAVQHI